MIISNNIPSLQASANLRKTNANVAKAMNNMTTGKKINSAADDAAGLAISNKLRVQIQGLNTASQNAMDGISLIQTAEGALGEIHNMLQRMRELAIQSSNDTLEDGADGDHAKIMEEIDALKSEITDTAKKTEYNKIKILSGELDKEDPSGLFTNDLTMQIGPNQNMEFNISIPKITSSTLNIEHADLSTRDNATDAIDIFDQAIAQVSELRAKLGAAQNRLEHTISSLDTTSLNTEEAKSRLEDTNMAEEMTFYSSQNVISQAAISILAQANQRPQSILQLLG